MKLIPEQVAYLREEILKLERSIKSDKEYYLNREMGDGDGETCIYYLGNVATESQAQQNIVRLNEYRKILAESEFVKEISTDCINVGTKFSLQFDGEEEPEEFILLETSLGSHMAEGYITTESPIGQSLIGKKEGERFSYTIKAGTSTRKIEGSITEIKKDKKDYTTFIRSKKLSDRRSLNSTNEVKNNRGPKRCIITSSQKELIEEEIKRLCDKIISKNGYDKKVLNERINSLKKLLKTAETAILPEEDIIDIGTSFSIMLFDEDETVFKRVEMIDQAYSDELGDQYIERISPLGTKVYGLKNQGEFIVQVGTSKYVSGIVYDISNNPEDTKTNNPLAYQRSKRGLNI